MTLALYVEQPPKRAHMEGLGSSGIISAGISPHAHGVAPRRGRDRELGAKSPKARHGHPLDAMQCFSGSCTRAASSQADTPALPDPPPPPHAIRTTRRSGRAFAGWYRASAATWWRARTGTPREGSWPHDELEGGSPRWPGRSAGLRAGTPCRLPEWYPAVVYKRRR